jgi:integrase
VRELGKLTATGIAKLTKPGRYSDGNGLHLQISRWGTKAWILRYQLNGRAREMGLGGLEDVSLKEARDRARLARGMLVDGIDPIEIRAAKKRALQAEGAKRIAFREAAEQYISSHRAGWRNRKHAAQWLSTLETYAYPIIGDLSVADIDTAHVVKILERIWAAKTDTASRVRGRIERILDWAKARHFREGENPARWKGHIENLLPAKDKVRKVKHREAMSFADVPAFMTELRAKKGISIRALEFTILNSVRTGEVIYARWEEFDLFARTWTIPPERTKSGRPHRVPLNDRSMAILTELPREVGSPFVFPGAKMGKPLSQAAMLEVLRGMRGYGLTVHGFRSSFRDWVGESTNFPREIAEAALGHVVEGKTEAAYRRGDSLEKRRRLMQAWGRYCATSSYAEPVTYLMLKR